MRIFTVFALLLFGALLFGCVSSVERTTDVSNTAVSSVVEVQNESKEMVDNFTTTGVPKEKLDFLLGETATVDRKQQVIVYSISEADSFEWKGAISDTTYNKSPEAGNKFVFIEVEMKNIGDGELFTNNDFYIISPDGDQFEPSFTYQNNDKFDVFKQLLPGARERGKLLFEVPEQLVVNKIIYKYSNIFEDRTKVISWNKN